MEPFHDHWIFSKHIFRYLRGTIHHRLKYDGKEVKLTGFTSLDWGGSETDGRSTTGGCFSLRSTTISWMSRKHDPVALSSDVAEYVAACEVGKEVVWLRKLLSDLFGKLRDPTMINCDNQSNIKMSKDPVFHARTKHINNKYHYIRSLVKYGVEQLQYIPTNEQVVDVLTKSLPNKKFEYFRSILGLVDITDLVDKER